MIGSGKHPMVGIMTTDGYRVGSDDREVRYLSNFKQSKLFEHGLSLMNDDERQEALTNLYEGLQ